MKKGRKDVLQQNLLPILDDIVRMYQTYEINKVEEPFDKENDKKVFVSTNVMFQVDEVSIEEDVTVFLSSNVMRNQLRGLSEGAWQEQIDRSTALG